MPEPALTAGLPTEVSQSPKRLAIIDAATNLFLSQGFGAVSVDAIAAQARVSKPTVYSHFENKEALFSGVMTGVCERAGGRESCPLTNDDLARHMPVADLLQKTGEHVLGVITSPEAIKVFRVVVGEVERFPQLGQDFFEFGPAFILKMICDYLADKSNSDELNIDDPMEATRVLMAMMVFPAQMQLACGVRDPITPEEVRKIVADALVIFMKIYGPDAK